MSSLGFFFRALISYDFMMDMLRFVLSIVNHHRASMAKNK